MWPIYYVWTRLKTHCVCTVHNYRFSAVLPRESVAGLAVIVVSIFSDATCVSLEMNPPLEINLDKKFAKVLEHFSKFLI